MLDAVYLNKEKTFREPQTICHVLRAVKHCQLTPRIPRSLQADYVNQLRVRQAQNDRRVRLQLLRNSYSFFTGDGVP